MTNALPSLSPVLHDIHVNVVSAEEASFGVAEFWSGDRMIAFTRIEDGDLALRIEAGADGVALGARALAEALAEANRLLALY
jgi:hypothetical protein